MILGIDPGLSGALAFFDYEKGQLTIFDMPVHEVERNGKAKREVSPQRLAMLVRGIDVRRAIVEKVSARPGQGVTSMFAFGRSFGVVEGVLAALNIPVTYVTPQHWRKGMQVREGKHGSRQRATELFPKYAGEFARVKDDGRAEASLIAYHGALKI
jgi:crossover junction endodeoxyribonuclease RuvC